MNDMSKVIVPKSDQINSDDLISGPRTIKIAAVEIRPGTEQPVSLKFEGDGGKPWKPCKSMSRILVAAWGADAKAYVGRSVTLYRDPTVKWAGMDVGGIRISHMSDIEGPMTMALTATKGSRKPFTVKPLVSGETAPAEAKKPADPAKAAEDFANAQMASLAHIEKARDFDAFDKFAEREASILTKLKNFPELSETLTTRIAEVRAALA